MPTPTIYAEAGRRTVARCWCCCANRFLFYMDGRGRVEKGGCVSFEIQLVCRERDLHSGRCRQPAEAQLIGIMSGRFRMSTDHTWPNWIGDTGFPVDAISATSKISLAGFVCSTLAQTNSHFTRKPNKTNNDSSCSMHGGAARGHRHHNHPCPLLCVSKVYAISCVLFQTPTLRAINQCEMNAIGCRCMHHVYDRRLRLVESTDARISSSG